MHSLLNPHPPSLLLSPLFFPPLLLLPAQASPTSRTSCHMTKLPACMLCYPANLGTNKKNACLAAERQTAYAIPKDKGRKRAKERHRQSKSASKRKKRGKNSTQASMLLGERVRKNENEVASRAAPSTASEKLHTGVPGRRLVAPPSP